MNIQLTQHFNLDEFTRSATAKANDYDNDLDSATMTDDSSTMTNDHDNDVIENLRNLCTQVLEPKSLNHVSLIHFDFSPILCRSFVDPSLYLRL